MIYPQTHQDVNQAPMAGHYIFIDSTIDDVDHLVKNALPGTNILVLDPDTDGITQISDYLQKSVTIEGIHIIAHAEPGCLYLGNQELSIHSLENYKDILNWVGISQLQGSPLDPLSPSSPQLYLYGCNLAAGDAGKAFLEALQRYTKMPIHASTTSVGSSRLGGSWDLDTFLPHGETTLYDTVANHLQSIWTNLTHNRLGRFFPFVPSIQYTYNGAFGTEVVKLTAFDGSSGDQMGIASDVHGNNAIVTSKADGNNVGSAYIYTFDGTDWQAGPKLVASDAAEGDNFGRTAAIYGNTAVVGAFNENNQQGAVYVFTLNDNTGEWEETAKISASDGQAGERFSRSIDLYENQLIVGTYYDDDNGNRSGSAYIYDFDGTTWQESTKLLASDGTRGDRFGSSVVIKGDVAVVGARDDDPNGVGNSGAAYVYNFDGTNWNETLKLTAGDITQGAQFGDEKVDIDGNYLVVGSPGGNNDDGVDTGSAYIFEYNGTTWQQIAKLTPSDGTSGSEFGHGVSIDGDTIVVGARKDDENGNDAGAAYVFKRSGNNWNEVDKLIASDAENGSLLGWGISIDGDTVILGAKGNNNNTGSAYIFDISGETPPPPPPEEEDGTITVMVLSNPQDGTDFDFSGDLGGFTLDDADPNNDDNDGIPNSQTFTDVESGSYTIVELPTTDFDLTSISINGDTDGGSSIDLDNRAIIVDLDEGEDITITFDHTQEQNNSGSGTITVEVSTDVQAGIDIGFNGDLGSFTLDDADPDDDDGVNESRTFIDVAVGSYTVTELAAAAGFDVSDIQISGDTDNGSSINLNDGEATIDLDDAEDIVILFSNTQQQPSIPGSITIEVAADVQDDTNFVFNGDLGSFSLDDSNDDDGISDRITFNDLTAGSYTITELAEATKFDVTDIQISGDADDGSSITLSEGEVTIDLDDAEDIVITFGNTQQQPSNGSGTIIVEVESNVEDGTDFGFTGSAPLGDFTLDDSAPDNDDNDGIINRQVFTDVAAGQYTITELATETGFDVTDIQISGDTDEGSSPDINNGEVVVDLDAAEEIVITFSHTQQQGGNGETHVGTNGDDNIEGTAGNDSIEAKRGDDSVDGGAGNDTLSGGRGNDALFGGAGDDTLNGNRGDDILEGGSGKDKFVFTTSFGSDTILDFESGSDYLDLSDLGVSFTALDTTGDGVYDVNDQFSTVSGESPNQVFRINLTSFGGGFLHVQGVTSFTETDFVA